MYVTDDDALSTYSQISVPRGTRVRCMCDADGETIELAFGVAGRATLDIDARMLDPMIDALLRARGAQRERAAAARERSDAALAAYRAERDQAGGVPG